MNWEEAQKLNLKYVFSNAQLKPNEHIHYVGTVQNFNANGDLLIYEIS